MKLFITRDQNSGLMGGVNFILQARVELTRDEQEIVKKYKAEKEILITKTVSLFGSPINLAITIGSLISGEKFKCKNIAEILAYENNTKEACEHFKNYIEVMRGFGGEEVIDY